MNTRTLRLALLTCACAAPILISAPAARAQSPQQKQEKPFLHALFSDDAVLQRDRIIPIWGWTTPGQTVTVKLDEKTVTARADAAGRWMAHIGPYTAGGPHTLVVTSDNATASVTRRNILFGDVWLCSGQSNMEMGITAVNNAQAEVAAANNPQIRLFMVPKLTATSPVQNVDSRWMECTPANIVQGGWGGFSAVGYFFGRKLNQELKIPIGLIDSAWGGTEAEVWVSESALGTLPDFKKPIAASKLAISQQNIPYEQRLSAWFKVNDPMMDSNWNQPQVGGGASEANWHSIATPGSWENAGIAELSDFDGIVLFRREVEVPAAWAGKDLTLSLGSVDDMDTTFWNGAQVGTTNGWNLRREYKIPGAQVKAGLNLIAIRVTDSSGDGGFGGPAEAMKLTLDANNSIPLNGQWKYRINIPLSKMTTMPVPLDPNDPHRVNVLYNGMIAPLEPFGLKGAIWYQGESNASRPEQYSRLLPTLIGDWRRKFASPLPFHIVQLAGFMAPDDAPSNDDWPNLRAAQMKTAQTVAHTGIAITTDIGDEKDIHPKDKQDIGLRLALSALAQDYGKKVTYSGPVVKSVTPKGQSVVVTFANIEGGLTLKGDSIRVFAVAGADRNWFWATPQIEGNRVILKSAMIARPLFVRYGWSNLPRATLYNGANLPAPPFQTLP